MSISNNSDDLTTKSREVLAESAQLQVDFIDTEIEIASTLIKVARTEYFQEHIQAARRVQEKAGKALEQATKRIYDAERKGVEMRALRKALDRAKSAFAELPTLAAWS